MKKEVVTAISMPARVWDKFRQLVLIEKGEIVAEIESELVRAHDAGDSAGINQNPLNAITRSLVHLVHESDSLSAGVGDDIWDVLVRLVTAADPDCDRNYELTPTAKPNDHAALLGKRMRVKTLADDDQFYHRVIGVSDRTGQTLMKLGEDYGTFVPEVLAVHPVDNGELTPEQWRLKHEVREASEDIPF